MKGIKSAEILCVGTELLLGEVVNTNAAYISSRLADLGVSVYHQSVVGDNPRRLREELSRSLSRCDLVIMTGGLGPTYDDLTKETAAEMFGKSLVMDERALFEIKDYFARTGRRMPESNEKQALVPEGAKVFYNKWGTAPGMAIEGDGRLADRCAILLPGPPREMRGMFEEYVVPYIEGLSESRIVSKNIHLIGIGESAAEELLRPLIDEAVNPTLAPYAKDGEVRFRVTASAGSRAEAEKMCDALVSRVLDSEVGAYVYGIDVGSVEGAVVEALLRDGETLATVESCTGGLIGKRLTDIAGVSAVYLGGAVTYANEAKERMVGVKHETLLSYGAVSEQTAREMAEGVRRTLGADYGISTTGIAGPGGGTPEKPVGTVYIALAGAERTYVKRLNLPPMRDREYIRTAAATNALALLLEAKGIIGNAKGR